MKIVVNRCYGGFGLSAKAEDLYAEKSGFEVFRYIQTKYKYKDGKDLYEKVIENRDTFCVHTYTKDYGNSFTECPNDNFYWVSSDLLRIDPILIEVIEELGTLKAAGNFAELEIVTIPDGTDWELSEYDGIETIHEKHKSW